MNFEAPTCELWELPPSCQLEQLPVADPSRILSFDEYYAITKNKENLYFPTQKDETLKKVVMNEIEKNPAMWSSKVSNHQPTYYANVGIEVYKRTGKLLAAKTISAVFKYGKDALRNRLRSAILRKLSPVEVEEQMWKWNFYGHIRFYRKCLVPWETYMKKQVNMLDENQEIYDDVDDGVEEINILELEEEYRYDEEKKEITPEKTERTFENVKLEEPIIGYEHQQQYSSPPGFSMPTQPDFSAIAAHSRQYPVHQVPLDQLQHQHARRPAKRHFPRSYTSPSSSQTTDQLMDQISYPVQRNIRVSPTSSNINYEERAVPSSSFTAPAVQIDFEKEMSQITYHATRIAREQPHRIKLIRKVLFDSVFAFDEKEYSNASDVYQDLADKNRSRN